VQGSIRFGKIFGIPIEVNASWVLIFLLLTYVLAQEFESARLGWPVAQRWSVAIATVVLFFLSVLAHELSHSVVARRKGIPVQSITLFIFGGVSRLAQEPDRPMTEFTVAGVGPLSSIMLAAIFGGLWYLLGAEDSVLEVVLFLMAWTNLWLVSSTSFRATRWTAGGSCGRRSGVSPEATGGPPGSPPGRGRPSGRSRCFWASRWVSSWVPSTASGLPSSAASSFL